jgi:hypothetical protein
LDLDNFQVEKIFIIENLINKIENIIIDFENNIYFSNGTLEIYSFQLKNYKNNETHQIKLLKDHSILIQNVKNFNSNITIFILGTRNNIITGHENGKICIWKNKSKANPFFHFEKMYQIHKGRVTNLLLINKPISQYGLNFNKKIKECIISNKQIKDLKDITLKQSNLFENEIENYISNYNDNLINEVMLYYLKDERKIQRNNNLENNNLENNNLKSKQNSKKKIMEKYIN